MRDLEADLAICAAATPGPWLSTTSEVVTADNFAWVCQLWYKTEEGMPNQSANAFFIATARTGWPHAIQRALDAEERVDKLQHELRMLQDVINQRGPQP
jgi:hypothetical protein